jgi:anti-sigma regulatory factor (Ser/Thr protein kinase)
MVEMESAAQGISEVAANIAKHSEKEQVPLVM